MQTLFNLLKVTAAVVAILATLLVALLLTVGRPYLRLYLIAQWYKTVPEAQAALARNPNDPKAHATLANEALRVNDRARAKIEFRKAIAAWPDNEVYRVIYAPLIIKEDPDEARLVITPALQSVNPTIVAEARAILNRLPPAPSPKTP